MSLKVNTGLSFREDSPRLRRRNTLGDIVMFLLAVGVIFIILLVPSVNVPVRKMFSGPVHPALYAGMTVWASEDAGIYYCPGSTLYGSGGGVYMKQGDALTKGYQPVLGRYCDPESKNAPR